MSETKLHKNAKIKSIIKFVLVAILGFALLGVGIHTVTSYSKTTELGITVMSTDNGTYHNAINGGRVFMNGENVGASSAQTLRVGQTTTLKAQANEGYSFVGFFTDESHNEKLSDKPVYAFAAGEDVSRIYASFAKNYDIEFTIGDPFNDGQTLSFTETLYVGQEVTVSDIIANNENLGEEYAAYYRNSVPEGSSSNDGGFSFSKNTIVVGTQSTAVTIQPTAPSLVGFAGGGGQGTSSSPYIINTAQHLINLANGVNAGDPFTGIYFRVDAPITLTNWTPIGGYDSTNSVGRAFEGIFDGNDQLITISSLASANADYASLFGYNAGTIKKVKITGAITGGNYVGAVAGYNTGTITDITSSVDVTATGSYIGGIVGVNGGKVSAAITTTDVTVKGENDTFGLSVGGIVGINLSAGKVYNLVNQCAVTGTNYQWVGGLVGQNHGTIENSFNVGTASGAYYVGGIAGQNGGGTIMNVYNAGDVNSSNTYVGGVTGYNNGGVLKYTYYLKGTAKDAELFQHLGVGQGEVGMPTVNDVEGETIQFVAGQNDTTETRKDLNSTGAYTSNGILSKTLNISGTNTTCLLDALNYGQIYVSKLSTEAVTDYMVWKTDDSFTYPTIHDGSVFETKTSLADYDAASGNGDTPETAYVIKTITHLQTFANEVNGGETYANKYFELGADIDAAVAFRTIGGYDATNSAERYFAGHFDGKGNTISGLTISGGSGSNENTKDYYGLFGYTYTGSTIKNLNVDITISGAENYVGGIVGYNMGTVSNVSFSGTITATGSYIGGIVGVNNGTVNDAINKATINGNNQTFGLSVGGVAGINLSAGHIYNGVNTGTVSGTNYQWVGGITGQNHGKLENSFNSGNVTGAYYVGGIAGQNGGGTINTAYSYGTIKSNNTYAGGVCGYNNGGIIQFTYYQTGSAKAGSTTQYGIGAASGTTADNAGVTLGFSAEMNNSSATRADCPDNRGELAITETISGYQTRILLDALNFAQNNLTSTGVVYQAWGAFENYFDYYPTIFTDKFSDHTTNKDDDTNIGFGGGAGLEWTGFESGDGNSEETAYIIKTKAQLAALAFNVNSGTSYEGKYFRLADNLDFENAAFRTIGYYEASDSVNPDRYFAGTFDGDDYTISGLAINNTTNNNTDYMGLFGYVYSTATIKNLNVEATVSGGVNYVGGVVGYNMGTLYHVNFTGSVTASGSYIGGIVGVNSGTLNFCTNTASVSATNTTFGLAVGGIAGINLSAGTIKNCHNNGLDSEGNILTDKLVSAPNYQWVGGIAGQNHGTILNSYNNMHIGYGSTMGGAYYVGGIVGQNGGGTIKNVYNRAAVIGSNTYVGGVCGYNNGGTIEAAYYSNASGTAPIAGTTTQNGVGSSTTTAATNPSGISAFDSDDQATLLNNLNTWCADSANIVGVTWEANTLTNDTFPKLKEILYDLVANPNGGTILETRKWTINEDGTATKQVAFGINYGILPNAERAGYSVDGWFTASSGGEAVSASTIMNSSSGASIYAQWTPNDYLVTLDVGRGTIPATTGWAVANDGKTATKTITFDTVYDTLPTPAHDGDYKFQGWFTDTYMGTEVTAQTLLSIPKNHTLYAMWKLDKVEVTANANGGTIGSEAEEEGWVIAPGGKTATKQVTPEEPYDILPRPTKDGYTYDGWWTEASGGTQILGGTIVTSTTAHTIWVHWKANTYTVVFNANGGSGDMANQTHTYDSSLNLTANTFTRTGYTFAGWATSADGNVVYSDKQSVTNLTTTADATIDLYAKWTPNTYTITLSQNGATTSGTTSVQATFDSDNLASITAPIKTGYKFQGWYTDTTDATGKKIIDISGHFVADEDPYTKDGKWIHDGTLTLYAVWKPETYTITLNNTQNGGTGGTTSVSATYESTFEFPGIQSPTKTGYEFEGWFTAATGGLKVIGTDGKLQESVSGYTNPNKQWIYAGETTLYAQFKAIDYTITMNANGGTGGGFSKTTYNISTSSQTITITSPTKTGNYISSWDVTGEDGGSVTVVDGTDLKIPAGVHGNLTVTPTWSLNTYTLQITHSSKYTNATNLSIVQDASTISNSSIANGGVATVKHTYSTTELIITLSHANDSYTYYISAGSECTTGSTTNSITYRWAPTSDVDLTVYTAQQYIITYNGNGNTGGSVPSTQYKVHDTDITLAANNLDRTGYSANGWNTTGDVVGTKINQTYSANASDTLYANWKANTNTAYSVEHYVMNTSGSYPSTATKTTAKTGTTAASVTLANVKDSSLEVANGIVYHHGTVGGSTVTSTTIKADGTLVIKLYYERKQYQATFDPNGGYRVSDNKTDPVVQTYYYGHTEAVSERARAGYTLTGYTLAPTSGSGTATGTFTFDSSTKKGSWTIGTQNETLKMVWTANTITITLDDQSATTAGSGKVYYKYNTNKYYSNQDATTQISKIDLPAKTGYTFGGYYSGTSEYITAAGAFTNNLYSAFTANTTLFAKWTAKEYTVSFSTDGGSAVSNITVTYDSPYGELPSTTKEGYTFAGWFTLANGGTQVTNQTKVKITAAQTLYAHWKAIKYTVSFSTDGGSAVSDITVTYDSPYGALPSTTKEGYTFKGWFKETALTHQVTEDTNVSTASDHTLYAKWQINTYTLTVKYISVKATNSTAIKVNNGASVAAENSTTFQAEYKTNNDITIAVVESEHDYYINVGSECTTDSKLKSISYPWTPTGNAEINVYVAQKYTITYNNNSDYPKTDTRDLPKTQYKVHGTAATIETNDYARTCYQPYGWNTSTVLTDQPITGSYSDNANLTLYLNWKANVATVDIKLDNTDYKDSGMIVALYQNGQKKHSTDETADGKAVFSAVPVGTYDIYATAHNATSATLSNPNLVNANQTITVEVTEEATGTGNATITYYTLTLAKVNGISEVTANGKNNGAVYLSGQAAAIEATPADGYSFGYWEVVTGVDSTIADAEDASTTVTVSQTTTLRATPALLQYTLTYNFDNGASNQTVEVEFDVEDTLVALEKPTKTGYTFQNWKVTIAAGNWEKDTTYPENESIGNGMYGNATLTAQWKANTYTIAYNANTGTGTTASSNHTYGVAKNLTKNGFTKTGYTFAGWAESANGNKVYDDMQSVTNLASTQDATVTLYAKWTEKGINFVGKPLQEATYNTAYTSTSFVAKYDDNTEGTFTYSIVAAKLGGAPINPDANNAYNGFEIVNGTNAISGTPSAAGSYTITVRATSNDNGSYQDADMTIMVKTMAITGTATITGDTVYGSRLTASVTNGIPQATYAYKWQFNNAGSPDKFEDLTTVTGSTLDITSANLLNEAVVVGGTIRVVISGTDNFGGQLTSVATASITALQIGWDENNKPTVDNKVYDANNNVITISDHGAITGVIAGDDCTLNTSGVTATFASADAGTHAITFTGYALSGANAGNYTLKMPDVTATITKAQVTVSATGNYVEKTYDGTIDLDESLVENTHFTVSSTGAEATVTATGTYADANAGKPNITATFTLADTKNFEFANGVNTCVINGKIHKATPTLIITSDNIELIYGNAASTNFEYKFNDQTITSGGGEISVSSGNTTYVTVEPGANNKITVTGKKVTPQDQVITITVTAAEGQNFVEQTATITVTVVQAEVWFEKGAVVTKPYDGNTDAHPVAGTNYIVHYSEGAPSPTVELKSATYDSANVGERTVIATFALVDNDNFKFKNSNTFELDGRITAAQLGTPTGLQWAGLGVATWSATTAVTGITITYDVVLLKNKAPVSTKTGLSETSFNFADENNDIIRTNGTGVYTFTVQAKSSSNEDCAHSDVSDASPDLYAAKVTAAKATGIESVTVNALASYVMINGEAGISITATPVAGYNFNGWTSSNNAIAFTDSAAQTTIALNIADAEDVEDITITANASSINYSITVDNELSTTNGSVSPVSYNTSTQEQYISITAPTRTGYLLTGLNVAGNNGTATVNQDFTKLTIAAGTWGKITLTPVWTPITYTIAFNGNGNTNHDVSMESQTMNYDETKQLTNNAFERKFTITFVYNDGKTENTQVIQIDSFTGWAESANGNKMYDDNASVSNLTTTNNATVTLYAKWVASGITLPSPADRPGYKFEGWYNGGNSVGVGGANYTATTDCTLTAKWTAKEYTVTASAQDGTIDKYNYWTPVDDDPGAATTIVTFADTYVSLPTALRTGYDFAGWWTKIDGGTEITSQTEVTITGPHSIYAHWTPITYTIAFNLDNGSSQNSITANFDDTVSITSPTKPGYVFNGWTASNLEDTAKYIADGLEQDWTGTLINVGQFKNLAATQTTVTLTANWVEAEDTKYTVKHFVMDTTGKYVEDQDAEDNLQGTTNATITLASLKDSALELENQKGIVYSHAEVDGDVATEAQILPAGDLVIKLYYNRLQYTVTLTNGTPNGITALIGADTYYYGESVTISATLKEDSGYTWHKWTSDNVNGMPSKIQSFTFTMPARGVSATGYAAIPVPDLIEVYPNEPDKITIVSYKGTEPNIVIPDKIDKNEDNMAITGVTYTVIAIAPNAFNGNSSLQSVSIPATVVTIGRYAFANCDSLTTIEIQATNVEIGENAFGLNTKDTNFSKQVYINDKNVAKTIVKSSLYANPNLGLSDYGNLLVDVNTVFVASSITELSDFLISSFEKATNTVTYRDVDYNVYRRRTNATATTFRREDDIEDEDITIEPDATL